MGGAIGARLLATGTQLVVFDLDPEKRGALVAQGATEASSAAEAARGAHAVILSLNAARIVRAAVFAPGGVAEGAAPGTLLIDTQDGPATQVREASLIVVEADLPPGADQGNSVSMNGTDYTVRSIEPDGTGMVLVRLELAD